MNQQYRKEKIEFHTHTNRSFDSSIKLEEKFKLYSNLGFTKVYITDHNRTWKKKELPENFFPGLEISSTFGHIILLNIEKRPLLNTLWYIIILKYINNNLKIIIPHPHRDGTGFFFFVQNRAVFSSYFLWFIRKIDGYEYFNFRDGNTIKTKIIPPQIFNELIKKEIKIKSSDSHSNDDIFIDGTVVENGNFIVDYDKLKLFIQSTTLCNRHQSKIYILLNLIKSARRVLLYLFNKEF